MHLVKELRVFVFPFVLTAAMSGGRNWDLTIWQTCAALAVVHAQPCYAAAEQVTCNSGGGSYACLKLHHLDLVMLSLGSSDYTMGDEHRKAVKHVKTVDFIGYSASVKHVQH